MKSWLSVKAGLAPQAALHLVAVAAVVLASVTEDLEVTAAVVIAAVIALHFGAMVVLPWRLSLLLSLSPVAFSLAFLLWAIDNGVDCSPSCSTYQDITAVVMGGRGGGNCGRDRGRAGGHCPEALVERRGAHAS
jgi:hypothetical protein